MCNRRIRTKTIVYDNEGKKVLAEQWALSITFDFTVFFLNSAWTVAPLALQTERERSTPPLHASGQKEKKCQVQQWPPTTVHSNSFSSYSYRLDSLNFHLICVRFFCGASAATEPSFLRAPVHSISCCVEFCKYRQKNERNKSRSWKKTPFCNYTTERRMHVQTHSHTKSQKKKKMELSK